MNGMVLMAAAAMLAGGAAVGAAGWSGEFALPGADDGFAFAWASPAGTMREFVPRGETVDRWTRMITVQQSGYRIGLTPVVWLDHWLAAMHRACPAAAVRPVTAAPLGDHAGAEVAFDCPLNPATGLPESVIARAVLGDEGIQTVQAAARRTFTPSDRQWAAGVVGSIALCPPQAASARCTKARTAAPGTPL